jgi:hypothetical protein
VTRKVKSGSTIAFSSRSTEKISSPAGNNSPPVGVFRNGAELVHSRGGFPRAELQARIRGSDVRIRGYALRLSQRLRRGRACLRQRAGRRFALTRAVSGIKVDVGPLRANAGDPTAAWVARALPGALAQALADVGRARAPISVRIDYVILGPSSGGVQAGGAAPDQDDR